MASTDTNRKQLIINRMSQATYDELQEKSDTEIYIIEDATSQATDTTAGLVKLYNTTGQNTDGTMTQQAITNAISGGGSSVQTINTLATSGTIILTDNSINKITPTGNITFTLPIISDNSVFHQILIQVNLTSVVTFDYGLGVTPHYFNKKAPDLTTTGNLLFTSYFSFNLEL